MNERLRDLAKRVDELGETVTMFRDPVDGSTVAALGWEELERLLAKLQTVAALDGATNDPAPGTWSANAGEFAARWNVLTPAERERYWEFIKDAQQRSLSCVQKDHEGLQEELDAANRKLAAVQRYADDRKAHNILKNNTLSSWRAWSALCQILGTHPADEKES